MDDDLPYKAEYAKSGRASCKNCKGKIEKEVLRLAVLIQSPLFDGKQTHWYHGQMCFFAKQRPSSVEDIAGFDSLRWEDQEKIKKKLEESKGLPPMKGGKGGKGGKGKKGAAGGNLDFATEYAKSGASKCKGCEEKIPKAEVRISKKDYEGEKAKMYGPMAMWHHVDCFINRREELGWFESAEMLPGFGTLSADDKNMLKAKIKKIEGKRKAEDVTDSGPAKKVKTEEDELKRKQNEAMYKIRDRLKVMKKAELAALLEHNDQEIPPGEDRIKDRLADFMTFGVPLNCEVCKNGSFVYKTGIGYVCQGQLSEWTRCTNVTLVPKRKEFKIPNELREAFPFLQKYKFKGVSKRIITVREVKPEAKAQNGAAMMDPSKPLGGMKFVIVGDQFEQDKQKMKDKIAKLGGEVVSKPDNTTAAVITTMDQIGGTSRRIELAKENNIHCVSEDFLEEVEKGGAILMIQKKSIAPWGGDPTDRVFATKSSSKSAQLNNMFTKSMPATQKMKLKGGAVVDADSGLEDKAHVYQRGSSKIYNAVLGATDLARGTNSYYKLQLLESDNKRKYWVFRSWGRIGTTIGGNKLEDMEDLTEAMQHFEGLFEEKTGNRFGTKEFKKVAGRFHMLDIDYGGDNDEKIKAPSVKGSKSKLEKPVQELVSMIFDIDNMKKTMVEYEIDLKKMPLGKISKRQIEQAYKILGDALELLKSLEVKVKVEVKTEDGEDSKEGIKAEGGDEPLVKKSDAGVKAQLLDCSNRFYTLIPHDFGMNAPPLLDNEELLKSKISMLESLSEIELAYNLLKSEDGEEGSKDDDPIDKHYRKLKTEVQVLDKTSEEFEMLKTYVKNTHAATHSSYTLELENVFQVKRQGEKKRYKPFKALPNRQLLWHGSRLTNWAGILSQGLRIAPPEAPVTGYMFGKGVYFADMVSKSANYCCTNRTNNTALLLLAEVALGNMYERKHAEYVEKLPKGTHSCKGLGKTHPDPESNKVLEDGTIVPLGKGVPSNVNDTSLLYNEFIVYDVAQINAKYLLKVKFNYK